MDTLELSLYLHIPFCLEKCDYCDFYSVPTGKTGDHLLGRYVEALLYETERRLKEAGESGGTGCTVPSVYIGGGTPSLLGTGGIARLLSGFRSLAGISGKGGPEEITVEANPETADSSFLRSCLDHGVTRLSLGVQSFNEGARKAIGRRGCSSSAFLFRRISEAAEIFGRGLSLDLMSGLPGQNEEVLLQDIDRALLYEPGHISFYALTLEEGTLLSSHGPNRTGGFGKLPPPETADRLWLAGQDALKRSGYEHYEVSNFALSPRYRCLHNIRYWRMKNWIGTGPAASGTKIGGDGTGRRTAYVPDTEAFVRAVQNRTVPPIVVEELDRATVLKETLLMGYRYREGPDPLLFVSRFGKTIEKTIPQTLAKWRNRAGNRPVQETIMRFLNAFLLDAFLELDNSEVMVS